jgi:hypothetical protein
MAKPDNTQFYNPVKFSVYRSAAQNTGASAFAIISHDTKVFDTGTNVDVATNKGRFTAPIAGFYQFNAQVALGGAGTSDGLIALYKNGSVVAYGSRVKASTSLLSLNISKLLQLSVSDYIEVYTYTAAAYPLEISSLENYFEGFLVSTT